MLKVVPNTCHGGRGSRPKSLSLTIKKKKKNSYNLSFLMVLYSLNLMVYVKQMYTLNQYKVYYVLHDQ